MLIGRRFRERTKHLRWLFWLRACRAAVTSMFTARARNVLRKHFSLGLTRGGVPVYVVQCPKRDVHAAWEFFQEAADLLETHSPLWWERMPRLFSSIVLVDSKKTAGFYGMSDRCCVLNPWHGEDSTIQHSGRVLTFASTMVFALSSAFIVERWPGYFSVEDRQLASYRAVRRFTEKFADSDDIDVEAVVRTWRVYGRAPGRVVKFSG